MTQIHRHPRWWLILLPLFLGLCILYYVADPSVQRFFPSCPLYRYTGWPCPGCGSQRAIHALLHGDFIKALSYNALLMLFIPLLAVLIWADIFKRKNPQFYMRVYSPRMTWSILIIALLWWIYRLILTYKGIQTP